MMSLQVLPIIPHCFRSGLGTHLPPMWVGRMSESSQTPPCRAHLCAWNHPPSSLTAQVAVV